MWEVFPEPSGPSRVINIVLKISERRF